MHQGLGITSSKNQENIASQLGFETANFLKNFSLYTNLWAPDLGYKLRSATPEFGKIDSYF